MTEGEVATAAKAPDTKVRKLMAGDDPEIPIYHVELSNDSGMWTETWGSEELLRAFLRGVQAGCSMFGVYVPAVEIPTQAEERMPATPS